MSSPPVRTERGVGTIVMIGVMAVMLALSLAGVCIAGYWLAAQRARTAADLAALSGATAYSAGGDPCAAARRNARHNDASVARCDQVGDALDFVVTVETEVRVRVHVPGLPQQISAVAYAGSQS